MKTLLLALIRFYQRAVSPLTPAHCRYVPSCSQYAWEAVSRFGVRRGLILSVKRLARCRPFGGYGYDPVPPLPTESIHGKKQQQ